MRRIRNSILVLCMMVMALSGCTNNNHGLDPDKPTSIIIWHYYNGKQLVAFEEMIEEFNETEGKKQGIVVSAQSKSTINNLYEELLKSANDEVGAEKMPNIFFNYVDFAIQLDTMGKLVDLDEYFTSKELSEYVGSYIAEGRFDSEGSLKVLPTAKSTEVLMINKTIWDLFAASTNSTLDELSTLEGLSACAKKYYEYTDALTPEIANDGKAFFGRDSMANYMLSGTRELSEEIFVVENGQAKIGLSQEVAKKLWDNFYIPYINGYFLNEGRFSSDDAKTGDIIALVGSSSSASYFPTEVLQDDGTSYPIECYVMSVPVFEGGQAVAIQQGAGVSIAVSDDTHEYASAVFLKWFTNKEQNIEFALQASYLPVKKEANEEGVLAEYLDKQDINSVVIDTLKVAAKQVTDYEMYTSKAFMNSNDARNVLDKTLINKAKTDRAIILNSQNQSEAIKQFLTEENFESWYNQFIQELNAIIQK